MSKSFAGRKFGAGVSNRRAVSRAAGCVVEEMERRVLLAGDPTILNTGVENIFKATGEITKLQDEVDKVHDKLFSVVGHNLPIVGTSLGDAVNGAQDAFKQVSGFLKDKLSAIAGLTTITKADIQNAIFGAFGPGGLGILPGVTTAGDVPIQLVNLDGNTNDAEEVRLNLSLNGSLFSGSIHPNFDIGLPGLGLSVNGTVKADVTYALHLNIGVNASGFFLDLSPTGSDPEAKLTLAITTPGLSADGRLGFLNLHATDGTKLTPTSATKNTALTGTASIDLTDGGDNKLFPGEVGSLAFDAKLDASAEVHLHNNLSFGGSAKFPSLVADFDMSWGFAGSSLNPGGSAGSFGNAPSVAFNNVGIDLGTFFSNFAAPIVQRVKDVLKPIQPVVDMLEKRVPVLSDIPVLNSKFDEDGKNGVSFLEVIDTLNPSGATKFLKTVVAVSDFVNKIPSGGGNVVISLGSFDFGSNGGDARTLAALKDLNLTNFASNPIDAIKNAIRNSGIPGAGDFVDGLSIPDFGGAGGNDGGGLHFPIIENPSSAFNMLLGKDVDLFTFDMPKLGVEFHLNEFFRIIGPLGVRLKGDFEANADVGFGYDTRGITDFANGGFSNPALLFNGFFVSDNHKMVNGVLTDLPEVTVHADINAFAELNAVVFAAGVGGGIDATIHMDLEDPAEDKTPAEMGDGKLRADEIADQFARGPFCLFDIGGKVTAGLSAYVQVGVDTPLGFAGWKKTFNIASATLLDFDIPCDPPQPDPVLAQVDGDALRLNMGPYAGDRLHHDTTDGDESFIVSPGANPGEVVVKAFGFTQTFTNVTKIYAEGGHGNDTITLDPGLSQTAELYGDFNGGRHPGKDGDFGNDQIYAGDGPATLHGNGGNDQLVLRKAGGSLYGDDGNDTLLGADGGDLVDGGAGDDVMEGRGGNDSMYGQTGDDVLDGGDGNDLLDAGDGNDQAEGFGGNDTVLGGNGNDVLTGGDGADSMEGGAGNDILTGDEATLDITGADAGPGAILNAAGSIDLTGGTGNDTMHGGAGTDAMFGQGGDDVMTGDDGADYMQGDAGNDDVSGGADGDHLIGDSTVAGASGNDSISGGDGDDVIAGDNATISASGVVVLIGGSGADQVLAGAGNDRAYGQGGADLIVGGTGDDTLEGNDGADKMIGDDTVAGSAAGNDSMSGGAGDDTMAGDNAIIDAVTLLGGAGNDTMSGGAGNDLVYGQGGADLIHGDADADTLFGNDGADVVFGDAGNDSVVGNDGNDTLSGDDGDDSVQGNAGDDSLTGGNGDDDLIGGTENDVMDGGAGNDAMLGDDGQIVRGGQVFNTDGSPRTAGRTITPTGGSGNDVMTGGSGHDTMLGQAGNDTMSGGSGDDDMIGGAGSDSMSGDAGVDYLLGDDGQIVTPVGVTPAKKPETSAILRTIVPASLTAGDADVMSGGDDDDVLFGQGGDDAMSGDGGMDVMEGNAGADSMAGGAGDDDLIGGSSVAGTPDGNDTVDGGAGNDAILGDNGQIARVLGAGNTFMRYVAGARVGTGTGLENNAVIRVMTLSEDGVAGADSLSGGTEDDTVHGQAGDDRIYGNDGNDDLYGELGADYMEGGAGDDGMVGDKGQIVGDLLDGSTATLISTNGKKASEVINVLGTRKRIVTLLDPVLGAADIMYGGLGDDSMHGGAGADRMYGDDATLPGGGDDAMFGDDGDDVVNGQAGGDHLYGGYGDDDLDGGTGGDTIYGGDGKDTLHADGSTDRLFDWFGNFNVFLVPGPGFGSPTIVRSPNPADRQFILDLAAGDGATDLLGETAIVEPASPSNAGPGGRP